MDSTRNQNNWNKQDIVASYARAEALQPAEENIVRILKDQWPQMSMLDIGVGGGRTSFNFIPLVQSYVGIDYAPNMVEACRKRFNQKWPQIKFHVGDVRSMTMFDQASFDFVLFSFNGISYIDHEGRLKALREIRRVLRPGGKFCFSAHNYFSMRRFLKVPRCFHPIHLLGYIKRSRQVQEELNRNNSDGYAVISDGAEVFRVQTYYVKPSAQIAQLRAAGFDRIRAFKETTGEEISDINGLDSLATERWIYFLCFS